MPCDSVIQQSVELGKLNESLLSSALHVLGWPHQDAVWFCINWGGVMYSCRIVGDKLFSYDLSQEQLSKVANLIKRSYAAEAVKAAAKRSGWQVKQQGQKLTLVRARV